MAKCTNCGTEGNRVRSRWTEKGEQLPDQCPQCAPSEFEKFTMPSDQKIWMGWEAHPNEYAKRYDSDGIVYEHKPEYRVEQEQRLCEETEEEHTKRVAAEAKKRATRRTRPMDSAELFAALKKARMISNDLNESQFLS